MSEIKCRLCNFKTLNIDILEIHFKKNHKPEYQNIKKSLDLEYEEKEKSLDFLI